jgi:nucleoside-diphosphate-sugar epimerase
MKKILITGATGQIGSELTLVLRQLYGADNVIAASNRKPSTDFTEQGPFYLLDVRNADRLAHLVAEHRCDTIFHLAALLSAVAETRPQEAWDINMNGLLNVLETARQYQCAVFFPSSIGAFGPGTPPVDTPQDTLQRPTTIYGITKVSGELLCDYYYRRFGVDTRGLRYPGLISSEAPPGGGSTDYAVEIFHAALTRRHYECFLSADTQLDMMYMPDAIDAALKLMNTASDKLRHRNAFNVTAMSFTPAELAAEIRKHIPGFTIGYKVDPIRQAIASSWPRHMNDSAARTEWDWQPRFDLAAMAEDMLEKIAVKLQKG